MKRADINIFLAIIAAFALALVLNDPNGSATPNSVWEPVVLRSPVGSVNKQPTSPLTPIIRRMPSRIQTTEAPQVSVAVEGRSAPGVRPTEYTARRIPTASQPRYLPPSVIRNRQNRTPVRPSAYSESTSSRVMPLPPVPLKNDQSVKAAVYRMGPDAPNPVRFAHGWTEL